jgi:hypothetical protein
LLNLIQYKPSPARFGSFEREERFEKFYVFALSDGRLPRVFDFELDQTEALLGVVRSEDILSVVRGVTVPYTHESVVRLGDQIDTLLVKANLHA